MWFSLLWLNSRDVPKLNIIKLITKLFIKRLTTQIIQVQSTDLNGDQFQWTMIAILKTHERIRIETFVL